MGDRRITAGAVYWALRICQVHYCSQHSQAFTPISQMRTLSQSCRVKNSVAGLPVWMQVLAGGLHHLSLMVCQQSCLLWVTCVSDSFSFASHRWKLTLYFRDRSYFPRIFAFHLISGTTPRVTATDWEKMRLMCPLQSVQLGLIFCQGGSSGWGGAKSWELLLVKIFL